MIELEPVIREELERRVPPVDPAFADWQAVLRRSGEARRRARFRLTAALIAGVAAAALAVSPLGGAVTRAVANFSDWLQGTPGSPAPTAVQRKFDARDWPGSPKLREVLRTDLDGHAFVLYGFAAREVVCLRLAVNQLAAGPQTACVPRAELRRTADLVVPVKANVTLGRQTRYVATFGFAADEVTDVSVVTDRGTSAAPVRSGAFLSLFRASRSDDWGRSVIARGSQGLSSVVPLLVPTTGEPPRGSGLEPHGPSAVTRTVTGGTIGWFVRREERGLSPEQAHVVVPGCCHGYTRVIQPDPDDFLTMLISDHWLTPHRPPPSIHLPEPRGQRICLGSLTHGGLGSSCTTLEMAFSEGPLAISWGFSGAGQQLWLVEGLASDDVARIEVFLGTGEHWQAPLRDNVTMFRVARAKFPVRIVAYDAGGQVIAVRTIRG